MARRKMYLGLIAAVVVGSCWVGSAMSQPARRPGGDRAGADRAGGDRRGRDRGSRDPEEMRRRMEEWRQRGRDRMREQLGATEDEWKVLQPLIEKVQTVQRESRGSRFGGFFGGRGRGRGGERRAEGDADPDRPEVEKKTEALRSLLEDKASQAGAIKAALDALRKARLKAAQDLAMARKELQQVVSVRQEAQLVMMSILD